MVIPLDSPQWSQLSHAYGTAEDVPQLIRAMEAEKSPNYHDGGAWFEVYSSLFHQHSLYTAIYAALPHIVRIAETGTTAQCVAIMCLAAHIQLFGYGPAAPTDLRLDFQQATATAKLFSLATIRAAAQEGLLKGPAALWRPSELIEAFGALRHPSSGYVAQLDHMVIEAWSVEAECHVCGETMAVELRDDGISTCRIEEGHRQPNPDAISGVDRRGYPDIIEAGQPLLEQGNPDWPIESTPGVLAALATELNDSQLATRILDLRTTVMCAYCRRSVVLSTGLRAL